MGVRVRREERGGCEGEEGGGVGVRGGQRVVGGWER